MCVCVCSHSNPRAMIIGGQANGRSIADVWLYTFGTREFEQLFSAATLPMGFTARYDHCATLVSLENNTFTNVVFSDISFRCFNVVSKYYFFHKIKHESSGGAMSSDQAMSNSTTTSDIEQFGILIVGGYTNQLKYVDDAWLLKLTMPYSFL